MTNQPLISRRRLVRSVGTTIAAIGLAGCAGTDGTSKTTESNTDSESTDDEDIDAEEFTDLTDKEAATVDVGGSDGLSFAPAEILISTGTTVTWEWSSQSGDHNVIETEGVFKSHEDGGTTDEAGHTFSYTFEEAGTYEYECVPHRSVGMTGTVRVEEVN